MNRLELAKRLHQELGSGQGELPGTLPSSGSGQRGRLLRMIGWTDQAWVEIQNMQQWWLWRRATGTQAALSGASSVAVTTTSQTAVTLTSITRSGAVATATYTNHGYAAGDSIIIAGAAQTEYNGTITVATVPSASTFTYAVSGAPATPATGTITAQKIDFDRLWPFKSEEAYPYILARATGSTVNYQQVEYVPMRQFAGYYDRVNVPSAGLPQYVTQEPNRTVRFYPQLGADATFSFAYRKRVQQFMLDTDVPELPYEYHMAIVYRAMRYAGGADENNRQGGNGKALFDEMYADMRRTQLAAMATEYI